MAGASFLVVSLALCLVVFLGSALTMVVELAGGTSSRVKESARPHRLKMTGIVSNWGRRRCRMRCQRFRGQYLRQHAQVRGLHYRLSSTSTWFLITSHSSVATAGCCARRGRDGAQRDAKIIGAASAASTCISSVALSLGTSTTMGCVGDGTHEEEASRCASITRAAATVSSTASAAGIVSSPAALRSGPF